MTSTPPDRSHTPSIEGRLHGVQFRDRGVTAVRMWGRVANTSEQAIVLHLLMADCLRSAQEGERIPLSTTLLSRQERYDPCPLDCYRADKSDNMFAHFLRNGLGQVDQAALNGLGELARCCRRRVVLRLSGSAGRAVERSLHPRSIKPNGRNDPLPSLLLRPTEFTATRYSRRDEQRCHGTTNCPHHTAHEQLKPVVHSHSVAHPQAVPS